MNNEYILIPIDIIENINDFYIIDLGNGALSMKVPKNSHFKDKNGVEFSIEQLKPGQEIYIKIFDENGVKPTMPTRTQIESFFLSKKHFAPLPDFILNN